eukprot:1158892-Pelagomonas_calceolata.AAC.20
MGCTQAIAENDQMSFCRKPRLSKDNHLLGGMRSAQVSMRLARSSYSKKPSLLALASSVSKVPPTVEHLLDRQVVLQASPYGDACPPSDYTV